MGEARGQHQELILHCSVEVAGTTKIIETATQPFYHCMWFLKTCARMQAWCDRRGFDTAIHPIPKCVIFLEDLLQEMVDKKSKDPFGTIRVARKALSKIRCFPHFLISLDMQSTIAPSKSSHLPIWIHRELQKGVPHPYGEQFSKETLIKSASSKAFAATTAARTGQHTHN